MARSARIEDPSRENFPELVGPTFGESEEMGLLSLGGADFRMIGD